MSTCHDKKRFVVASVADPDPHGSGIIVPDPDPAKMKEQINKNVISHFRFVNSGLCVV